MTLLAKLFHLTLIGFGTLFIACEKKEVPKQESNQPNTLSTSTVPTGGLQIKAKLVEIPGPFPANDLYNYVYVMRYEIKQVLAGEFSGKDILVGQYNPRIPRAEIKDDRDAIVDGNATGFELGEEQILSLSPLDSIYAGAIEDEFFRDKRPRWFATSTNRP